MANCFPHNLKILSPEACVDSCIGIKVTFFFFFSSTYLVTYEQIHCRIDLLTYIEEYNNIFFLAQYSGDVLGNYFQPHLRRQKWHSKESEVTFLY